jgi:hypothetical protein
MGFGIFGANLNGPIVTGQGIVQAILKPQEARGGRMPAVVRTIDRRSADLLPATLPADNFVPSASGPSH